MEHSLKLQFCEPGSRRSVPDMLNTVVHTNSDHMTMNLLMQSDICSLGIDFLYEDYKQYPIRNTEDPE